MPFSLIIFIVLYSHPSYLCKLVRKLHLSNKGAIESHSHYIKFISLKKESIKAGIIESVRSGGVRP